MGGQLQSNSVPVHTYPDILESATFSFPFQKFLSPHVAYSNRIRPPTRIRWYPDSLQYPRLLCTKISSEHAPQREIVAENLLSSPSTLCRHIGLLSGERLDTLFTSSDKKNIRIHPSIRYRIRCGFIFFHSGPVQTLSDSLRIYFFPLWRADLFFSGFAVEFAGYVWTVPVSGKKSFKNAIMN